MRTVSFYAIILVCIALSYTHNVWAQLPYLQHTGPVGLTVNQARMNDLQVDATNNKWVCFAAFGLGIYDGSSWTIHNASNSSMPSDSVICVDYDNSGNAWIGTKLGAVYKSGTNFTVYNTGNSGLPADAITAVLSDGAATWFGTRNGLASFNGSTWTTYNTGNSGLENDSITTLALGATGTIWIGTRNGLASFNGSTWTTFNTTNSVLSRYIYDLEFDNYGRMWISCGKLANPPALNSMGIFYVENGSVKTFATDLYSYDLTFTYSNTTGFTKDNSGRIIFYATFLAMGKGVFVVDGNNFEFFKMPPINYGNTTLGGLMTIDNNNKFWVLPRYNFYFYELDFNGYNPPLNLLSYLNHCKLDIGETNAGINVSGDMHWDLSTGKYEVPKGSGKHSVFASAFWIGGVDNGGQLHIAAQTYRQTGMDYWPGPIDGLSVPFDSASCSLFDRIWKVDKWKVEEFKNQFQAGNVTNGTYAIPSEISTWPAKGNGIITGDLAPFVDLNSDNIYNPANGDYPLIKGDQMLYHIFNDSLAVHGETGGQKMGVEVHASAYAFYCPGTADSNHVLNRATFYNYEIVNKSSLTYNNVYIGLWSDMDIGNAVDDYVGCDTALAAGFTYNGDNDDAGISGYGFNPPIQNIKILRGVEADANDGVDNDLNGTVDETGERTGMNHFQYYNNVNNLPIGNPDTAADFYNYMRSFWLNGDHVTYGGDGTNTSNPPTNFMFSGTPYAPTQWNEASSGNLPEDRRFVMTSGPFTLSAGETATIDFAYVFSWYQIAPNGVNTSIARNLTNLQQVQSWFDNNSFPSCQTYSVGLPQEPISKNIQVYPNPAVSKIFLVTDKESMNELNYTIYDLFGQEIINGGIYSGSIDISKLVPQIYVLEITSPDGNQYSKFMKQ